MKLLQEVLVWGLFRKKDICEPLSGTGVAYLTTNDNCFLVNKKCELC